MQGFKIYCWVPPVDSVPGRPCPGSATQHLFCQCVDVARSYESFQDLDMCWVPSGIVFDEGTIEHNGIV